MKATELAIKAKKVATDYRTSYIWGGFGSPITEGHIQRAINQYSKNETKGYAEAARRYLGQAKAFYFDCVGLIKALLWGWTGDSTKTYGGAKYASNGVPDISADQMITKCSKASADFANVQVGEVLWTTGHIGIYIGNGLAVECTPAWDNGVQITAVGNMGKKSGYHSRTWKKHGMLPYVTYTEASTDKKNSEGSSVKVTVTVQTIKSGDKGDSVKALQILLNGLGYACGAADGIAGAKTVAAVKKFQKANKLTQDGITGAKTWDKLLN